MKHFSRGFTLIELLVVIAIIAMLSSVALSTLASTRERARDAAIVQDLKQLANLAALEYDGARTYAALQQYGWNYNAAACDADFTGNYAPEVRNVCKHILQLNRNVGFYSGVSATYVTTGQPQQHFSFMAYLPSVRKWACIGSKGFSTSTPNPVDNWGRSGCYNNP